ncbi:MAG: hypothetical protein V4623_07635 [Pseudomonadota bacterium]
MGFSFFKKQPKKVADQDADPQQKVTIVVPAKSVDKSLEPVAPVQDSLDFSDFEFDAESSNLDLYAPQEAIDPVVSDTEQAAIFYANNKDEEARAVLEHAVRSNPPPLAERAWLMLFDFYRVSGQKTIFESLELEYARAFEKSPPIWRDAVHSTLPVQATLAGDVLFQGDLIGTNEAGFLAVSQALKNAPKVRIDLSQVAKFDELGCARLYEQLQRARKSRCEIELLGRGHIGAQLEAYVEPGRAEGSACWLLLLELYQLHGQQEAFEEAAINYATTFEMSPPSWQPKLVAPPEPIASPAALGDATSADAVYKAQGYITDVQFEDLLAFAAKNDPVIVDCSALSKITTTSVAALFKVLEVLRTKNKKSLVLRHPNYLVAELFRIFALDAIAQIDLQRPA